MATSGKIWGKRLGNNTKSGLEDIISLAQDGSGQIMIAAKLAAQRNDTESMLALIKIRDFLGQIERKAKDAIEGKYE